MKLKRILSVLMCLVMVLGLPFAAAADPILGVEDNIFPPEVDIIDIDTKAELAAIREDLWGYYRLTADLKFTAADGKFTPIPSFRGVLDGNGHTISGLTIDGEGLFVENKGTVSDLRLVGLSVSYDDAVSTGISRIGGIAGANFGTIKGCAVYGTLNAKIDNSRISIGSIAGHNSGTVMNCAAGAEIGVERYVNALVDHGGIVGRNEYWVNGGYEGEVLCCYSDVVMNIYNSGTYTATHSCGFIVGHNQNAVVEDCYYPEEIGSAVGEELYNLSSVDGYVRECYAVAKDGLADAANFPALNMEIWKMGKQPVLAAFACIDEDGNKVCDVCGEEILVAPPVITTQPTGKTVTAGSNATFSVVATGEGLSYQWFVNVESAIALNDGANFSGTKTATLTIKTTGTTWCVGGQPDVFCRITNEGGSVDTATVSIKVNHKSGAWKTVKEATTSAAGLKEKRCTACNTLMESQSIPKKQESKPLPTVNFTDVKKSDFFYTPVQWAVANGVTTGTSPTTFGPAASCTRAQAVTFLWRAAGSPAPKGSKNPFTDVKKSDYYYKAVLWAVENSITTGTSSTTFSPSASCTRGQIVAFLWRAQGSKKVSASNPFKDVKKSDYFYNAVLWAVKNNVTTGTSPTAFSPNATCTRGQIVTFLYRAIVK